MELNTVKKALLMQTDEVGEVWCMLCGPDLEILSWVSD
jgi:hypothetical protein